MHCKSKRRARLTELPRSIQHAKSPFSIHFNDYITENCSVWYQCVMAERFKAVILVTSTFVRKRSSPDFGKMSKSGVRPIRRCGVIAGKYGSRVSPRQSYGSKMDMKIH